MTDLPSDEEIKGKKEPQLFPTVAFVSKIPCNFTTFYERHESIKNHGPNFFFFVLSMTVYQLYYKQLFPNHIFNHQLRWLSKSHMEVQDELLLFVKN